MSTERSHEGRNGRVWRMHRELPPLQRVLSGRWFVALGCARELLPDHAEL